MFPGGKGGLCVRLTTLPPSCDDCLEKWEPQPPGTLRACQGLYRDCCILTVCNPLTVFKKLKVCKVTLLKTVRGKRNDIKIVCKA